MQVELEGKVALVTGAARSIGLSIADTLAANGATVYYTDVDVTPLSERAMSVNARTLSLNVADAASIEATVAAIVAEAGRIDILVNNAGVNATGAKRVNIDEFSPEEWDRIINIDLTGVFHVSRAVLRAAMLPQRAGRIINISSVVGLVPLRLQCAYAAAKAGVAHLTKTMAIELGAQGILVNAVAPGSTLTEGTRDLFYGRQLDERTQQMLAHIPLGRPGEVQEMAHAVLFLAAPESSYITGQVLAVDGGWTAGYMREFQQYPQQEKQVQVNRMELVQRLCEYGVVAVFRTDQTDKVLAASQAIYDGGVPFIQYTMTMPGALALIVSAARELPADVILGAGTVLDAETARAAILAGAQYIVSPGLAPEVVTMAHRYGVAVVPGVYTPTEVMQAISLGVDVVKLFPACGGGPRYLAEIQAAFQQVRFMAAAGVSLENLGDYIAAGACAVTFAGQGLDAEAFAAGDFGKITAATQAFLSAVRQARLQNGV